MSVTISNAAQICNSPLNLSQSKMLYTFSKGKRFGADPKSSCAQICYDLPPLRNSRSTSLGYGNKYDFTQGGNNCPAPNVYQVKDFVNENKKKGFSFGLSREAMAVTGGMFVGDKKSPGPGAYDTRESNKVAISYSFKSRTPGPETLTTMKQVPGPGAYPTYSTMTDKGNLFVSKYKSSGANTFAPARSGRFSATTKEGKAPGPGQYELGPSISSKGTYFVSKFKDSGARSFGHGSRSASSLRGQSITPGPGSYKMPSDFGHYEAANAHKVGATESASPVKKSDTEDKKEQ